MNIIQFAKLCQSQSKPTQQQTKRAQLSQKKQQPKCSPLNIFKNTNMLKEQLLLENFYQAITGLQKKQTPQIKITPVTLVNKIQQSRPHYQNCVIYKQLALDVLLQNETIKTYKVKNCISPARPNSQIYKRLSKDFFENLKNGIDQCLLFTGQESKARLQSSIGNQNNPGMFMIVAIALLDQKYKENHERFDTQFSFLEYKNDKIYDLINYTQIPLQPKVRQSPNSSESYLGIEFCEHRTKISTFLQFIKLFKIALFNNKERDIRTDSKHSLNPKYQQKQYQQQSQEMQSTFIMKIRIKKYGLNNELVYEQETMLIDLEQKGARGWARQDAFGGQDSNKLKKDDKIKSVMDYILIEINNSSPLNKPIHYHMVEKNLLLQTLKKYLRVKETPKPQHKAKDIVTPFLTKEQPKQIYVGGSLLIVNSLTTNPYTYQQNIKLYENLLSAIGSEWEACAKIKDISEKKLDRNYANKVLQKILNAIKNRTYSSLRDLYAAKEFYTSESKKLITSLKTHKSIIVSYLQQKKKLFYNQNLFSAYQLQLIGNCIKSDNFKDFYTSKSFLALPRQVQIKTQNVKNQIVTDSEELKQIQERFWILKKKDHDQKKSLSNAPDFLKQKHMHENQSQVNEKQASSQFSKLKFKPLQQGSNTAQFQEFNDLESFVSFKKYILDYFTEVWYRVYLTEQRTVAEQLIFEDSLTQEIQCLKQKLTQFIEEIGSVDSAAITCMTEQTEQPLQSLTQLIRSINQAKKSILKYEPKHPGRSPFSMPKTSSKKQNIYRTTSYLPKIQESVTNFNDTSKRQKSLSSKILTDIKKQRKVEVFEISGKVDFQKMILAPKRGNC